MIQPTRRNLRTTLLVVGGLFVVFGVLATHDMWLSSQRRLLPTGLQAVMFLGPIIIAFGVITFLCGLSLATSSIFRRSILVLGLLMLAAGGFPWMYTHYLTGGRPGNESAGMLGTLIFLFVGLPGIAVTLAGVVLSAMNLKKNKSNGKQAPANDLKVAPEE